MRSPFVAVPLPLRDLLSRVGQTAEPVFVQALIAEYLFEPEKLRLAALAFYSPDFFVLLPDGGVEFHEIKGRTTKKRSDGTRVDAPWSREDAKLKIRFAAERFWWYRFAIVFPLKTGGCGRVDFGPHADKKNEAKNRDKGVACGA